MDNAREALIDWLVETQRGMGRHFARARSLPLLASNLTMPQLKLVMFLAFHGSTAGQDIARQLGVGLGTVTGIVDRVIAQGLATRREDPHDRRVRRVELTPKGHALAEEILDTGTAEWRAILSRLDTDTLRDLERVFLKLDAALHDDPL
ncbi:MarR family transcriptional regulator [Streptosporangiaceae bacterium NEAU-GS5]|nr:MarR family transcriptional regulator [Streptosporangiaceae bacterium NEAU-GS5]